MRVRYLSGNLAGCIGDLPDVEAEVAIQTGYAEPAAEPPVVQPEASPELAPPAPALDAPKAEAVDASAACSP